MLFMYTLTSFGGGRLDGCFMQEVEGFDIGWSRKRGAGGVGLPTLRSIRSEDW